MSFKCLKSNMATSAFKILVIIINFYTLPNLLYRLIIKFKNTKHSQTTISKTKRELLTTLQSLPPEIILEICKNMHYKDILSLSKTSSRMRIQSNDNAVWKSLLKRDYNIVHINTRIPLKYIYIASTPTTKNDNLILELEYKESIDTIHHIASTPLY